MLTCKFLAGLAYLAFASNGEPYWRVLVPLDAVLAIGQPLGGDVMITTASGAYLVPDIDMWEATDVLGTCK